MFTNKTNPYDISNKIKKDTISVSKCVDVPTVIKFNKPDYFDIDDKDNTRVNGDNKIYNSTSLNPLTSTLVNVGSKNNRYIYNYISDNKQNKNEIEIGFGAARVKRMYLRNYNNFAGNGTTTGNGQIHIPNMSENTPQNNNGEKFFKKIQILQQTILKILSNIKVHHV